MIQLRLLGTVDLRDGLNGELRRVLAQPKRLAILAFLALAEGGFRRRDVLLAQFWPDLDASRARAALRQALHHLRHELGDDALASPSTDEIGIDPAVVSCDVTEFLAAVAAGDDERAVRLYRGDLLTGLYFADASSEWESWLDGERAALREKARAATRRLAAAAEAAGDVEHAAAHARRAFELSGEDERAFQEMLTTLGRLGDVVGVRKAFDAYVRRLEREYEMQPSAETRALVSRLTSPRGEDRAHVSYVPQAAADQVAAPSPPPAPATTHARRMSWRSALFLTVPLLFLGAYFVLRPPASKAAPVLAVGAIRDASGNPEAADALSELLTTQLARGGSAQVISSARIYELAAQIDTTGRSAQRLSRAALAAGATEFIEGTIYRDSAGLRLEIRRTDLKSGRALASRAVVGADVFTVAERAGASLLGSADSLPGQLPLRDVVTGSVVPLRFYQEGLRAHALNDRVSARQFFSAAVKEDSGFAMAVFRLAQVTQQPALYERALRLASHTSDRERLIIRAALAHEQDDPARAAFADTLAVRYPAEPDGLLMRGRAQIASGQFLEAAQTLRRVIVMDSMSLRAVGSQCRACDAYGELSTAYNFADSLDASERVAREFIRRAPHRLAAWAALAGALQHQGKADEGRVIVAKMEAMSPQPYGELGARNDFLQREGRYEEAEAYLVRVLGAAQGEDLVNALWSHIIVLRNQGRYREALRDADRMRELDSRPPRPSQQFFWSAGMRALVLQDMGRHREAALLRDSIAHVPFGVSVSRRGRSQAGEFTHQATAWMLAGDTAAVRRLIDSVQYYGARTGFERERRMHHYVRGVHHAMLGRNEEAVQELRRSIYSPTVGYIRANYEFGRALLATGRAREAVGVMEAALRGSLGAGGLYATRTEMEFLLAQAREAAGDKLGAAAAYARVASAWEHADPSVQPKRSVAAAKARALAERP